VKPTPTGHATPWQCGIRGRGFSDVHKNCWGVGTHRLALETRPVSWLGDDTGTCPLGYCRRRNIGSMPASMNLEAIQIRLAVCRLDAGSDVPRWVDQSREFTSVTRTMDELSVVCARDDVPEGVEMEGPWRAFRVKGPIAMTLSPVAGLHRQEDRLLGLPPLGLPNDLHRIGTAVGCPQASIRRRGVTKRHSRIWVNVQRVKELDLIVLSNRLVQDNDQPPAWSTRQGRGFRNPSLEGGSKWRLRRRNHPGSDHARSLP